MDEVWLEVADIAQAVGISQQAIRKRVRSFITRTVTGSKGGGASGNTRYQLLLSSLPDAWQAAWWQRHGGPEPTVIAQLLAAPTAPAPLPQLPHARPQRQALVPVSFPATAVPPPAVVAPAPTALQAVAGSDPAVYAPAGSALSSPTRSPNDTTHLKEWQRRCLDARLALLQELDQRFLHHKPGVAMDCLIEDAARQALPAELQALVPIANGHRGTLSRRTLARWLSERNKGLAALAPRTKMRYEQIPRWAAPLLKRWQQPQSPALTWIIEELAQPGALPADVDPPSLSAARRFLDKMDAVERQRGRMGPRALKNIQPYRTRDISGFWPTEIYSMDGHTFDAEVAHPFHGRPFRPEVTTAIDVATRRIVGWSVALAESSLAILDALRHACESQGIPAILYVDNGKGYRNALMEHQAIGFMARLGITKTHSWPGQPQGHGVIERAHRTIWIRLAKQFPTYMGKDMDDEARNRVYKITRNDIKARGTSRLLPDWSLFLNACAAAVAHYNRCHEHSSLPRIRDAAGRKRHQTPDEAWNELLAQNPEALVRVTPDESADLFRPYKVGKVVRGQVRLFGNLYHSPDLAAYHNEPAFIGYDIHDPNRVWVRDRNQQLIAIAALDGNKGDFMPMSALEHAHVKRAQGRRHRLAKHLEEVELELSGGRPVIEGRPATPEEEAAAQRMLVALGHSAQRPDPSPDAPATTAPTGPADTDAPTEPVRPRIFTTDLELWNWVDDHPDLATEADRAWLAECLESNNFRLLVEIEAQKKSRVKAA